MGVLIPGTTSWPEAIPIFLVAVALLFVPGTIAGLMARLRPMAAVTLGPVLSTTFLTFDGVVCGAVGIRWTVPVLLATLAITVGVVGGVARLVSRRQQPLTRGPVWATAGGLVVAFTVFLVSMLREVWTPEEFPQHPDTIYHLGAAQHMLERADISVLHAGGFITPSGTGFYPAAFHDFTASIALLTGSSVVVATSVFVVAVAGLAWPLGVVGVALSVLGCRPGVAVAAAVTSVAFTGFPYFLMGFGVLWPNLFGQALLPSVLLLLVSALGSHARPTYAAAPRWTAILLLAIALPGLALAHPNALVSWFVFAAPAVLGRLLGRAKRARRQPRTVALDVGLVVAIVVATAVGLALRPVSMYRTGAPGPERTPLGGLRDLLLFSPRGTTALTLLAMLVFIGAVVLLRRYPGGRWVVAALAIFLGLFWLNVAVDSPTIRYVTWPWYNNAVRIQSVAILPAAITATATFVSGGEQLKRFAAGPRAHVAATSALVLVFLLVTQGYVGAHADVLHRYFHPMPADSWASDQELRSLRALSARIPSTDVVAANPWNGGTYLYIVSGRHLLIPTEKANTSPDRQLLSLHLNQVGTKPAVCAAAELENVNWAITGGQPFSWARGRTKLYAGIDAVGRSSAWKKVAYEAPYTLYERVACAR